MALSKTTQDHDEIKAWAEERGGKPAEVASTEGKGGPGIIRLEFPGAVHANDSNLKEISWDDFFAKFDESNLALVYQDVTADGEKSNFNRLIHPENASGGAETVTSSKKAKKSSSTKKAPTKVAAKKATPAKAAPPAKKTATAKKAPATTKKTATKAPAKPSSAKTPAKKTATAPAKKTATAPAKKAPVKGTATKKAAAKKAPAKKSARR